MQNRSEFLGRLKPEKLTPVSSGSLCSACNANASGPIFVCASHTDCSFCWCWPCMVDLANQHAKVFVRRDIGDGAIDMYKSTARNAAVNFTPEAKTVAKASVSESSQAPIKAGPMRRLASRLFQSSPSPPGPIAHAGLAGNMPLDGLPCAEVESLIVQATAKARYEVLNTVLFTLIIFKMRHRSGCRTGTPTRTTSISPSPPLSPSYPLLTPLFPVCCLSCPGKQRRARQKR